MAVFEGELVDESETPYIHISAPVDPSCDCALGAGEAVAIGSGGSSHQDQAVFGNATSLPYYVLALLPSDTPRWNEAAGIGTPANVTFSFMTQVPYYARYSDSYRFAPMSEAQKTAARAAMATWADVANITFTEVSDAGEGGSIRFGTNDQGSSSSGYAWNPGD